MSDLLKKIMEMSVKSKIFSLIAVVIIVVGGFVILNNNQSTKKSSETDHKENKVSSSSENSSNNELTGTYADDKRGYYVIFEKGYKAILSLGGSGKNAEKETTYDINKDDTITFIHDGLTEDKMKFKLSSDKKSIRVYNNTNGEDGLDTIMKKTSKKIVRNKEYPDESQTSSSEASSTSNQSSDYNPATSNKSPYDNNKTTDRPQDSLKGSADQDVESADQINQNIKNGANAESSTRFATGSDVVGGAFN